MQRHTRPGQLTRCFLMKAIDVMWHAHVERASLAVAALPAWHYLLRNAMIADLQTVLFN